VNQVIKLQVVVEGLNHVDVTELPHLQHRNNYCYTSGTYNIDNTYILKDLINDYLKIFSDMTSISKIRTLNSIQHVSCRPIQSRNIK